jgi:putative peptidoglycan lipid II flippase
VLIAAVTVLARLLGFARIIVFARTVGPSCLGDTYYTANAIPNIVFDVVAGGALSSLVIPVLAGPVAAGDRESVDRTSSALLTWAATLLLPVMVLGIVAARPLVQLLVGSGHAGCLPTDERAVGARMLVVFMPQVVLYGAGIVLTGVVQAHRRFLGPAIGPLVSSIVVIGCYLGFDRVADHRETDLSTLTRGHELILSVGTTLGVVGLVVPLILPAARSRLRLRPTWRFPDGVAATVRRLAVSGAVVLGSQQLATAVVLRLANDRGSDGSVVIYTLAWTVFLLPWAVIAVPLATSAFPDLTARWQGGDTLGYTDTMALGARVLVLAGGAAAATLLAAAAPAARLVILGAPGSASPVVLSRALVAFAPGVVGFGLTALLSRSHYARGQARTTAIASAAGWLVAVVVDLVVVRSTSAGWTVASLGAGTSVGVTVTAAWLLVTERRSTGHHGLAGMPRAVAGAVIAAVVGGAGGALVARAMPTGGSGVNLLGTAAAAGVAVGGYLLVARLVDADTVRAVADRADWRRA